MKILILNWRDIKNPSSGGAEILTYEVAKRLIILGHQVIWFSSSFPNALPEEEIDGIRIIRRGKTDLRNFFGSVHFLAFRFYQKEMKGKVDVVIDEIHGIPFFTPWYVKEKKIFLICEVADGLWIKIFGPILGTVGQLIERFYLKFPYKNTPCLTISPSTKKDLISNGIKESNITVLPMGVNIEKNIKVSGKERNLTLIFVGRLTVAKGIEDAIFALKEISKKNSEVKLWIVGRGDEKYVNYLKKISHDLSIEDKITFFGYLSERKKFELLGKAHVLIHPSIKEGFGLTIPEAGFVGTPVIAYNSSGLRDIVGDNSNGILLKDKTPKSIAKEALSLFKDKNIYKKLSSGARNEAKRYDWENTSKIIISCLEKL
ncbi:glycosyltransferase family 1 protein [Candidatus Microgenomates bacterium]|nr:MAG: glycosyltransferase family 1 protein [Candidatus Microgenomates bacterium]